MPSPNRLQSLPGQVLYDFSSKVVLSALLGVLVGHAIPLIFIFTPKRPVWPSASAPGAMPYVVDAAWASLMYAWYAIVIFFQRISIPVVAWLLMFMEEENPLACAPQPPAQPTMPSHPAQPPCPAG